MALPITALVIGGFASLTMLTKNSFLDEIGKQYVLTARAKGLTERRVLYGHVFRNAMLIVDRRLPGAFIGILFTGSLLIEMIFSLDGLGLLGFEAAINRDYPVMFGTLYIFTLLGLLMQTRRRRASTRWSIRASTSRRAALMTLRSLTAARLANLPRQPARLLVAAGSFACCSCVTLFAELHRQRPAAPGPLRRRASTCRCCATIPRRRSAATSRPRPTTPTRVVQELIDAEGLDALAADPLQLRHRRRATCRARRPAPPSRAQPARHRRPGARRAGAADLRLPHLGAVRLHR